MSLDITVRHGEVSSEIMQLAKDEANGLLNEYKGINSVHVIMDKEKGWNIAEVIVRGRRGLEASAKTRDGEMKVCLEKAFRKVDVQINKHLERRRDKHSVMKRARMRKEQE
jgi:ribosome-associated translation inhibitor RaiA